MEKRVHQSHVLIYKHHGRWVIRDGHKELGIWVRNYNDVYIPQAIYHRLVLGVMCIHGQ